MSNEWGRPTESEIREFVAQLTPEAFMAPGPVDDREPCAPADDFRTFQSDSLCSLHAPQPSARAVARLASVDQSFVFVQFSNEDLHEFLTRLQCSAAQMSARWAFVAVPLHEPALDDLGVSAGHGHADGWFWFAERRAPDTYVELGTHRCRADGGSDISLDVAGPAPEILRDVLKF